MLAQAGLIEGENFDTVLLDGFDPVQHIAIESIVGFPGYKSNEPGQLERAGIEFDLFDPLDYDIPGSFGVIYTNQQFIDEHPTAAEDFVRATMLGLDDAIADPEAAADIAVERINAGGNPNFLSPEGEAFRWTTDAALISSLTPEGTGLRRASGRLRCRTNSTRTPRSASSATPAHRTPLRCLGDDIIVRRLRRRRQGHLAELTDGHARPRRRRRCQASGVRCRGAGGRGRRRGSSWAISASTPSNLRSLRRKCVNRTSAVSP